MKDWLKFNELEQNYFLHKEQFVYFIIANVLFYAIAINAHANLGENYLAFAGFLIINVSLIPIIKKTIYPKLSEKIGLNKFITAQYCVLYVLFSMGFGLFKFDSIFVIIIVVFLYVVIKTYNYIVPPRKDETTILMDYIIMNDFDSNFAFHKYELPFKSDGKATRSIQSELEMMQEYNKTLDNLNRIDDENFNKYKEIDFMMNSGILLLIYQTILKYTDKTIKTPPIKFKLLDERENLKPRNGAYILEFKFDRQNLIYVYDKQNKKKQSIKHGIEEISTVIKERGDDVKIKHGMNKGQYIIRVHFFITQEVADEVLAVVNKINQKFANQLDDMSITGSSGLTTVYDNTEDEHLDTI